MVLKNNDHSGGFFGSIDSRRETTSEGDDSLSVKNEVGFQHTGCRLNTRLDIKTLHDTSSRQADSRIEARNSYKSNASIDLERLQEPNFSVMSAKETLPSRPLVQDSDGNSSRRRANHLNDGASCGMGKVNNFGRGAVAIDGVTISGNPGLSHDTEDRQLEFKKRSKLLEASNYESTSSSSDKCHDGDDKVFKSNKQDESEETHVPPLSASPESDVEEDVKVCDICGDAGREDLLAVCSRCSDGAEHTYCMREMLDEVPEGDWLCEECKCNEVMVARRLDHSKKLGSYERSKYLGRTCSSLSDSKDPSCERPKQQNISMNRQSSSKFSGEKMDSFPPAKKQALESSMGSPRTSSPSQTALPSKDVPFKIPDKIKGKPSNTGAESREELSENARSPSKSSHSLKGNFLKSNSFSSSNSKQNAKVSEDVLPKQGADSKEGVGKSIGKSMSFKGLGRSSSIEPKVKMLPTNCAPIHDLKGQKHGRDRISYERKNTMKLDNSLPGQIPSISTNRSSGVSDVISSSSVTNTRDHKSVQTDGKLPNMSNHVGQSTQKSSDIMINLGDAKKLSTSVNGNNNVYETKVDHFSVKDGPMISSSQTVVESLNADGARADGPSNQSEKGPEKFSGSSRQGLNNGMVSGSRRRLPVDVSALKNKDGMPVENKLKAAIEAAMQKKQDMLKKNKILEKPHEGPVSNKEGYHGGDAVSNKVKDPMSEEARHEVDMDLHDINSPVGESVLTVSAIPEQESIWQGGFEIHRNGKLPDMCGGFQAHISMLASGKVHEMVGKLPNKIVFNEVPRPSAWPVQFKELGAREDNIALYFFAKDSESYMRSYKILVDYMMKHDLALRGNINGAELLVFPSNHLPHESKCWNTLYFIWGVFRGRRTRFLDDRVCSVEKCEISISDTVMLPKDVTSVENSCLPRPAAGQLSVSSSETSDHNLASKYQAPVKAGLSLPQCASLSNGNCYKEEFSVGKTCLNSPAGPMNHQRFKNNYASFGEACPETGSPATRDQCQQNPNRIVNHQKSTGESNRGRNLASEVAVDKQDNYFPVKLPLVGMQENDTVVSSLNLQKLDTGNDFVSKLKYENSVKQETGFLASMEKSGQLKLDSDIGKKENMNILRKNEVKSISENGSRSEGQMDINASADRDVEDLRRLQCSPKRHFQEDSISLTAASITCKKRPRLDKIGMTEDEVQGSSKKYMKGFDGFSECQPPFGGRVEAEPAMGGAVSSSSYKGTCGEADDEKTIAKNPRSDKGCFFLVDSHHASRDRSLPVEVALSDHLLSESPNLELALGVKKKQESEKEGVTRFFAEAVCRKDPDRPPDVVSSSKEEEEDEDDSASLSLSLGFPFPDKERVARPQSPLTTVALEQTVSAPHDINTSLLLFRGSPAK